MSELRETLINITEEKNAKIIPSNIKEGVQIFDVIGEYSGMDTSDATIAANDIAVGKIGYNKDGKVIGTVETIVGATGHEAGNITFVDNNLTGRHAFTDNTLFRPNATHTLTFPQSQVAQVINLTPNKLVKGNVILGVEGTTEILNTSDATAHSNDIAQGKTAYISNGITTGTLEEVTDVYDAGKSTEYSLNDSYKWLAIYGEQIKDYIFRKGSKILLKADYSALANLIGIKPEEVKAGISYLGIEGTLENLDTSDGTAKPEDLLKDKVAYVNGERIIGELETLAEDLILDTKDLSIDINTNELTVAGTLPITGIVSNTATLQMTADGSQVVDAIGLAPDMLKSGTTILGVEGTYSGDAGEFNAKLSIPEGATNVASPLAMLTSVQSLDTANLTSIINLFSGCIALKSIPEMNLNNASSALYAFKNCYNLIYTPNLYMPKVHTLTSMFENCYNISYINLTYIGPNYMHYFDNMYSNCYSLKELPDLVYNNAAAYSNMCRNCWNLTSVNFKGVKGYNRSDPYLQDMFYNCVNLKTFDGFCTDPYHYLSNTYAANMFYNCTNLVTASNMNMYNGYFYVDNMFYNCTNLTSLVNFQFSFSGSANNTFANCYNLKEAYNSGTLYIQPYRGGYNTFANCYNLSFNNGWVNAVLTGGNYGGVYHTFRNCHSITSANVITSARNYGVGYVFENCSNLTEANITINGSTSHLFSNCSNLKKVNVLPGTSMVYTNFFANCTSLDNINTSIIGLNWEGFTSGSGMFTGCTGLQNFGVPKMLGYNLANMFSNCHNLVSTADTIITEAVILTDMYRDCHNLRSVGEFTFQLNASARPVFSNMFVNCTNLTDVPAIVFTNYTNIANSYAYTCPFGMYNAVINGSILPLSNLVNFGGFIDYGIHAKYDMSGANNAMKAIDIVAAPNLSYQSLQNVVNGVYNLYTAYGIAAGGTLSYPQLIRMANTQYEKLTEEDIGILTSKGWNVSVHNIGG